MILYYNKIPEADGAAEPAAPGPQVRRHPERAAYDRETIDAILDEGLVGHLGFVSGEHAVRDSDALRARRRHALPPRRPGKPAARDARRGVQFCFTVTLLDGLVLARSAFHHSLNYRSVVVLGRGAARVTESRREARRDRGARRARAARPPGGRPGTEQGRAEGDRGDRARPRPRVGEAPHRPTGRHPARPVAAGVGGRAAAAAVAVGDPIPDPACSVPEPPALRPTAGAMSSELHLFLARVAGCRSCARRAVPEGRVDGRPRFWDPSDYARDAAVRVPGRRVRDRAPGSARLRRAAGDAGAARRGRQASSRAALSLADGSVVADPFHPSTALVDLLRARARQLTGSAPMRSLRSIRAPFRARLRLQSHR